MKTQKDQFQRMAGNLGAMKHSLGEVERRLGDFSRIEETCADTEKYLGYILPIRMQYSIYKNLAPLQKDKEARLLLMENTEELMNDLVADLDGCNERMESEAKEQEEENAGQGPIVMATFNKSNYTIPDLRDTIKDLQEMIKEEEEAE